MLIDKINKLVDDIAYSIASMSNEGIYPTTNIMVKLDYFSKIIKVLESDDVSQEDKNNINSLITKLNQYEC